VAIANANDSVRDAINRFNVSYGAIGLTNIAANEKQVPIEASTDASQSTTVTPTSAEAGITVYHSVVDALQSHGHSEFGDVEGGETVKQ